MKKRLILVLAVLFGRMVVPAAMADVPLYSIRELSAVTSPEWQQTYEAYGRTIEVDAEVRIPDAAAAPVIAVQAASPVAEPLYSELKAWYTQAKKDDRVNQYAFRSTNFNTAVTHATPPAWGDTRDSEFVAGAMGQNQFDLYKFDLNAAYADNNALTVAEAISIARQQVAALYPDEAFQLRNVYVSGRTFWKQNGQSIRDMGSYNLKFTQVFHGIPFMASVHQAFSLFAVGNEDVWLEARGTLNANVYHADAWSFHCCLYQETGVLHEDVPLLPFDAVKDKVEALIRSGHVRWIDDVSLGYVQFDTDDPNEQVLVPCWVVWCEYHPDGARSERTGGENSSASLLYDGNSDYYRPLIINAQTGEMIDPENETEGRCLCPPILTD